MKNLPIQLLLIILVLFLLPDTAAGFQLKQKQERDSLRIVRDSLINVVRIKDSLLFQASLDSLFLNNLLAVLDKENDSLQHDIRTRILKDKIDSVQQWAIDSINRDFNRYWRWGLRDSLYKIDEDSVRRSLDKLLGIMFHNEAISPEPDKLRKNMSRLFYHLANDSLYFFIINSQNDTVPFVLKKNYSDSTALFLVNSKQDSVKVFLKGEGKSDLFMWADDNFKLSQLLRKKASADLLRKEWENIARMKLPRRKVPAAPPKYWKTGGNIDVSLSQMAFSHWKARGGTNRISLLFTSKGFANYKKGKMSWNNSYSYRYGVEKLQGVKFNKNIDQLIVINSFHHKAYKKYDYSITSDFRSQLFPGYRLPNDSIPVSKFMSKATYTVGLGMVYKPGKGLEVTGNPLSGQFTFVLDTLIMDQKKIGVPEGKRVKSEIGTTIFIKYKKVLWKNINLNTSLKLFRSYVDNPVPDIDWRTTLDLRVNKYLSTKFYINLMYDDDAILPDYKYIDGVRTKVGEGKFLQVQQTFGITFKFPL